MFENRVRESGARCKSAHQTDFVLSEITALTD